MRGKTAQVQADLDEKIQRQQGFVELVQRRERAHRKLRGSYLEVKSPLFDPDRYAPDGTDLFPTACFMDPATLNSKITEQLESDGHWEQPIFLPLGVNEYLDEHEAAAMRMADVNTPGGFLRATGELVGNALGSVGNASREAFARVGSAARTLLSFTCLLYTSPSPRDS